MQMRIGYNGWQRQSWSGGGWVDIYIIAGRSADGISWSQHNGNPSTFDQIFREKYTYGNFLTVNGVSYYWDASSAGAFQNNQTFSSASICYQFVNEDFHNNKYTSWGTAHNTTNSTSKATSHTTTYGTSHTTTFPTSNGTSHTTTYNTNHTTSHITYG